MKKTIFTLLFGILVSTSQAQCMLYEVPLLERLEKANWIIEGEVLQKQSLWDATHQTIYTLNQISVSTLLKGQGGTPTSVLIKTEGGQVDDFVLEVNPSLQLEVGQKGIFCLNSVGTSPIFEVFADAQGFIRYDESTAMAGDVFAKYEILPLKRHISDYTQFSPQILYDLPILKTEESRSISISSFSPTSLSAGTGQVLTITGSGFGTQSGSAKVQITDPDYNAITYSDVTATDYISWTDTEIKIAMNGGGTAAGTGNFKIFDISNASATSATPLTVTYNRQKGDLGNKNGLGGYTFEFNTLFYQNTPAVEAIKRAMETWRCTSGVNFNYSSITTSVDTALTTDNVNIIRWGVLPTGVLGKCYWAYQICTSANYNPKTDIDVVFSKAAINWNFGPNSTTSTQTDLESVALHEFGHGLGLGHVSNTGHSMYPIIFNGTDVRNPHPNGDALGADYVMNVSTNATVCSGITAMIGLNANNCHFLVSEIENSDNQHINITPNPNNGVFTLSMTHISGANVTIWNNLGQKMIEKEVKEESEDFSFETFPKGIYFIKVMGENRVWEKKVILN